MALGELITIGGAALLGWQMLKSKQTKTAEQSESQIPVGLQFVGVDSQLPTNTPEEVTWAAKSALLNSNPNVTEITKISAEELQRLILASGGVIPPSMPAPGNGGVTNWGWILPKPPEGQKWTVANRENAEAGKFELAPIM